MRRGIIKKIAGLVVLAVMVISMLFPGGTAAAFSDIEGHWAGTSLRNWLEAGLAGGYPDGTFRPNNPVTRAEFVTFLNQAFALSAPPGETRFTDVPVTAWFYDVVSTAVEAGIVTGYPDGTFKPQNPITRQEAAVVLARLLDPGEEDSSSFTDDDQIASWAANAVNLVAAAGIVGGYPDGSFRPGNPITRAETVIVLDRGLAMQRPEQEDILPRDEVPEIFTVVLNETQGLEGVQIQIYGDADRQESHLIGSPVSTDASGSASTKLADGMYWFRAVRGEYRDYLGSFFVDGRGKTVTFTMAAEVVGDPVMVPEPEPEPLPPSPPAPQPPQEYPQSLPLSALYREGVGVFYEEVVCWGVREILGGVYNVELEMDKILENWGDISGHSLQLTIDGKVIKGIDAGDRIIDTFLLTAEYAVLPAIQQGMQDQRITVNPITLAEGTVSLVK